jgi:glycosyltransferase involved in cell wall biosynthesis
MRPKPRLLRITTVPMSLKVLLDGQLDFFQEQGFEILSVSADGSEVKDLRERNIPHVVVQMTRKITPFKDFFSLLRLIRVLKKFKPDIVHSHTPKAGLLGMFAAWLINVPVRLHTVAGLPLMEAAGIKKWILIFTERITYACANVVYPNSAGLLQFIQREIKTGTPLRVIGNGSSNGINTTVFKRSPVLELQALDIRKSHGISEKDIVFSFVGRIVRDKGIGELINAFKKLRAHYGKGGRKIYLLLVGTFEQDLNPLRESDFRFLHECAEVILPGYQKDVRPWIVASDIFVFPSYREGFPNVVMQASCLEIPCIVSDINGSNEIITHGKNGLIVTPKDADQLFDAMQKLSENPAERQRFGALSRMHVVRNFDQQYIWHELLREYQQQMRHAKYEH